jgi:hypothetical protein
MADRIAYALTSFHHMYFESADITTALSLYHKELDSLRHEHERELLKRDQAINKLQTELAEFKVLVTDLMNLARNSQS